MRLLWAMTKILSPKVIRSHWGPFEKVVLISFLTSWSLTLGAHFCSQKTPNTTKSSGIFNSKLGPYRALIFGYSNSLMDNFFTERINFGWFQTPSWGKLGPKLDQKCRLWECPAVVKIRVFHKALCISYIPMRTTCGQNFSFIGGYLPEYCPQTPQNWA